MTVVPVPIKEVELSKTYVNDNSVLRVCSHNDQTLVTLHFLNTSFAIEATALQAAIQRAAGFNTLKKSSVSI
jgi:hypothetical protein